MPSSLRPFSYFIAVCVEDGCPKIKERYPATDWKDTPMPENVAMFCIPELDNGEEEEAEELPLSQDSVPSFFTFVLSDGDGRHSYGAVIQFFKYRNIGKIDDDQNKNRMAICLLSDYPYFNACHILLSEIYKHYIQCIIVHEKASYLEIPKYCKPKDVPYLENMSDSRELLTLLPPYYITPLETVLTYIISECELPPPNSQLQLNCFSKNILIPRYGEDVLPFIDPSCFEVLFSCLDATNIATLLNFMCLEERILLISDSKGILASCGEALCALLFPFCWQHIYIPLLPRPLRVYLQAPVPIFMGIHSSILETEDCAEAMRTAVIVNLDHNTVITPIQPMNTELHNMPEPQNSRLIAILRIAKSLSKNNLEDTKWIEVKNVTIDLIRMGVLEIFLDLLENFDNFLLPGEIRFRRDSEGSENESRNRLNVLPIDDKFNKAGFLETIEHNKLGFMTAFINSQMFLSFIQDILDVNNNIVLPDISLFLLCYQMYTNKDFSIWKRRKMLEDQIVDKSISSQIIYTAPPTIKPDPTPSILNLNKNENPLPKIRSDKIKSPRKIMNEESELASPVFSPTPSVYGENIKMSKRMTKFAESKSAPTSPNITPNEKSKRPPRPSHARRRSKAGINELEQAIFKTKKGGLRRNSLIGGVDNVFNKETLNSSNEMRGWKGKKNVGEKISSDILIKNNNNSAKTSKTESSHRRSTSSVISEKTNWFSEMDKHRHSARSQGAGVKSVENRKEIFQRSNSLGVKSNINTLNMNSRHQRKGSLHMQELRRKSERFDKAEVMAGIDDNSNSRNIVRTNSVRKSKGYDLDFVLGALEVHIEKEDELVYSPVSARDKEESNNTSFRRSTVAGTTVIDEVDLSNKSFRNLSAPSIPREKSDKEKEKEKERSIKVDKPSRKWSTTMFNMFSTNTPEPAPVPGEIVYGGYLQKSDKTGKDILMKSPKGSVDLLGAKVLWGDRLLEVLDTPTSHVFQVCTTNRVYNFCATSALEVHAWIDACMIAAGGERSKVGNTLMTSKFKRSNTLK